MQADPSDAPTADSSDAAADESARREQRIANLRPYWWQPGQSGNPAGKVGVLAKRVRHLTNQGRDVLTFLNNVMKDEKQLTKYRLEAARMLLDRGWGLALSASVTMHLHPADTSTLPIDVRGLPPEELLRIVEAAETLRDLLAFREGAPLAVTARKVNTAGADTTDGPT